MTVYLFTNSYPYGKTAETFLEAELEVASKMNLSVIIIPLWNKTYVRKVPDNIEINPNLARTNLFIKIFVVFTMLTSSYFWFLPFHGSSSPRSFKNYKHAFKYLYGGFLIRNFLLKNRKYFKQDSVLYSYWLNHTSLGFALARKNLDLGHIRMVSRAHGYDVYEELVNMYFPYRKFTLENLDHVFCISQSGKNYLINKYPDYSSKLYIYRLGIFPVGSTYKEDKEGNMYSVISCSSVNRNKRVELIFSSINNYTKENPESFVKWTHIGTGPLINQVQKKIELEKTKNLEVVFTGHLKNCEVRKVLGNERFDAFINLSKSEGIPVSIMEAISAGIPVLATDVGGVGEIVTSETGRLLQDGFSQIDFNIALGYIFKNGKDYRKKTKNYFAVNYDATTNYYAFYSFLLNQLRKY